MLFSNICISEHTTPDALCVMVAASRDCTLSVSCTFSSTAPPFSWLIPAIRSLTPRMVDLTLASASLDTSQNILRYLITAGAPLLQTVSFSMHMPAVRVQRRALDLGTPLILPPFNGIAPSLTSLTFANSYIMWGPIPFLRGLQSLHLTGLDHIMELGLDDYFRLFRATPLLQRLHLSHLSCHGFRHASPPPSLFHLTHLEFEGLHSGGLVMLEKLALTSVRTLRVLFRRTDNVENILLRVGYVFNNVTTAILDLDTTSPGAVLSLIGAMPCIRLLDLRNSQPFVTATFASLAFRATPLVPSLFLVLVAHHIDFAHLRELLSSGGRPGGSPLLNIYMPCSAEQGDAFAEYFLRDRALHCRPGPEVYDYYAETHCLNIV
jgi:hypothetical protein